MRKAKQSGCMRCIVPYENAREGAIIEEIEVIGVSTLEQTIEYLLKPEKDKASVIAPTIYSKDLQRNKEETYDVDFSDMFGMMTTDLRKAVDIAPNTLTKMRKDGEVSMSVLLKIATYLDCDISDICEFVKDEE